jgi:hypothetical protein
VLVMEFEVGRFSSWVFQVGFSSWRGQVRVEVNLGVQVGLFKLGVVNSWFPFFDEISLHTK